nr:MAG TPA: portal protein [Caudoviricetes sp.]
MEGTNKMPPLSNAAEVSKTFDMSGLLGDKPRAYYSSLAKIIYRDLNNSMKSTSFSTYTKEQITTFVQNPETNEQQLRDAVIMLYNLSPHFMRLVHYFADLCDLAYNVVQVSINDKRDANGVYEKYLKTAYFLSNSDLKTQCKKILTTCFREDVCYCTAWVTKEGLSLQILDPNYCKIASYQQNCWNVAYDFSYFDTYNNELELYPKEFQTKYSQYQKDTTQKWIELDAPYSFAIKVNSDLLYPLPPFVGILRAIYDLEDYKNLSLSRTELDNYCLLAMKIGLNSQGEWTLDFGKAKEFWQNLEHVLPSNVGSILTPMDIEAFTFDESGTNQNDKVAAAEQHLWDAAGVSSLIFSGSSTSSRALEISGMADESMTWGVVQSIGVAINRILQKQSFSKDFRMVFLPSGRYTRDAYQKSLISVLQYGLPVATSLLATMGIDPLHSLGLNHIETDILDLSNKFRPLQSSNTISSADAGRPESDNISDEGERTRDKQ